MYSALLDFHSFPTRRSSDLPGPQTINLLARLYKANAVRLGLAADYCEDTEVKVVVVAQGGQDLPAAHPGAEDPPDDDAQRRRTDKHTSELQSRENLVCRLLL